MNLDTIVSYCFSSPDGDVVVDAATMDCPFVVRPFENHPFMSLGDYFTAVKDFILEEGGRSLAGVLSGHRGRDVSPGEIDRIVIRYEKYGTLYQICSVDVLVGERKTKVAVSAAISARAKETLDGEFDLLRQLNRQPYPYLPRVYRKQAVIVRKQAGVETLLMSLSEWFDGYHEWHFSRGAEGRQGVVIWDMGGGYRFASKREAYEIIRQASRILTLYFNTRTHQRIHPWHHGAGDFVVKTSDGAVDVRLVTARGYVPLVLSREDQETGHLRALCLFLLELSVRMRLDKREGMGESTWADASILPAVIEGALGALSDKGREDGPEAVRVERLVSLLKSLTEDEIRAWLLSRLEEYRQHDESDHAVIAAHVDEHAHSLCEVWAQAPARSA